MKINKRKRKIRRKRERKQKKRTGADEDASIITLRHYHEMSPIPRERRCPFCKEAIRRNARHSCWRNWK